MVNEEDLDAEFVLANIRRVLADDKNYRQPSLKIGGIWSLCDKFAEFTRFETLDHMQVVEMKRKTK